MEQELQMPSCLFGGPPVRDDIIKLGESQIGFMNIFAMPLFEAVTDILPAMRFAVDEILSNKAVWESKIDEERRKRKKPSLFLTHLNPSFSVDPTPSPLSEGPGRPSALASPVPTASKAMELGSSGDGGRRESTGSVHAAVIASQRSSAGMEKGSQQPSATGIGRDDQGSRRGSGDASLTAILVTQTSNTSDSPPRDSTPKPEDYNRGNRKDTLTRSASRKKDRDSTRPVTAPSQARRSQGK